MSTAPPPAPPPEVSGPGKGARLKVYWTGMRRWYKGNVLAVQHEDGKRILKIQYDDGDVKWHDLSEELWLHLGDAPPPKESGKKRPSASSATAADEAEGGQPAPAAAPEKQKPAGAAKKRQAPSSSSQGKSPKGAAAPPPAPRVPSPPPDLPPLIDFPSANVDVFPCGVVRVRGAVPPEARQRLWDTVMCAGFFYREVESQDQTKKGANMWYTKAAGAPDILLHYNYYETPQPDQPPPMALLSAADAVFRRVTELEAGKEILSSEREAGEEDEEEEAGVAAAAAEMTQPALKKGKTVVWEDEAAADQVALAKAVMEREAFERRRLLWPTNTNFRSVLAIGYKSSDSFRWHTDLAGEDGWVCSLSVGATAAFEYLPTAAPSALRRARAIAGGEEVVRIEVESGDAILFHGGLLAHRIASVEPNVYGDAERGAFDIRQMAPYVRLNLQVRVYGHGQKHGLRELLKRGFEYVH